MNEDLYGLEASGIDPEIAAKMLGAKRKRKVTEAMLQQSMSPMNPNRVASGGIAVPISAFEALAKVAQVYMGQKGLEGADKELAGLASENQKKVASAMAGYEKTRMGDPGVQMPTAVDDEGNSNAPNEVAPVKGDPRRAIAEAMASPLLQKNALVQNDLKSLQPRVLGRTLVDGMGNTVATDSTWAEEQRNAQEARAAQSKAALEAKAAEGVAQRQAREENIRLMASLRPAPQPVAPSFTEVLDPKDQTRLLRVDGKAYKGGTVGDIGVLGVSGKEPTAAKKAEQVDSGKGTVSGIAEELRGYYKKLKDNGGIVDTSKTGPSNLSARISASGLGQLVGGAVGTQNQSARNSIAQTRPLLLNAIKQATGMSAKQMDSNAELKMYLAAATDPTLDVQANEAALANLERLYGLGNPKPSANGGLSADEEKELAALRARFGK